VTISFQTLWDSHPYPDAPCSTEYFENQCAIRMGVALAGAGVDIATFRGAKCYPGLKHDPRHILRAQELADWLALQGAPFGEHETHTNVTHRDFASRNGVVFIQNGWGATDHIDVWNGSALKGGELEWFTFGDALWFWEINR